jgi:aminoglycoside 3-N-acetyltransferase
MNRLHQIIQETDRPSTLSSLRKEFQGIGISPGMVLAVHSSLSSIGYVVGGAVAVVLALEEALGSEGTLAMPTHTGDLSDPAEWSNPAVPKEWHDRIRAEMPAFRPAMTPTCGIGAISECFRSQDGVQRSNHPSVSWAAQGKHANPLTENHVLEMSQGETSPLARLYELDAYVLLLGVGYESNTCFHLAEYRCEFAASKKCKRVAPTSRNGKIKWVEYDDIYWYEKDFPTIGVSFECEANERTVGLIGQAESRLFSLRKAVDYAANWMNKNRSLSES